METLLADTSTDVEVVARELDLSDEMRERLRRALDRLGCAQRVLEATDGRLEENAPDERAFNGRAAMEPVGGAVKLLAEGWPQDYPEGAVEWLLLQDLGGPR
ncbi:hypothetical protein FAZ95_03530 [Trinickia violacea]|uniref:Uncharacterized protein n=1 Tax=Trinickia violacea TaxID=2571746 RepID=A0A4P8IJG7_9BURK|nr:hypothetical protein [Trinickia violacea]QCP48336.1 hypothetical protein FAZ95_03530 [Trinickia violacea]